MELDFDLLFCIGSLTLLFIAWALLTYAVTTY